MQSFRRLGGLVCIAAVFIVGCTQSDGTKTASADKDKAANGKPADAQTPTVKTPAASTKPVEPAKTAPAVVARAKDNETKPVPESAVVAKPKAAAEAHGGPKLEAAGQATNSEKPESATVLADTPKAETVPLPSANDDSKPPAEAPLTETAAGLAGEIEKQNVAAQEQAEEKLPELTIGSVAPVLTNKTWIKGEAVDAFQPGKIYVVEFWATWCGPCLESMPHISKLQKELGDKVQFIGVSVDADEETVRNFMEQEQGPKKTWRDALEYTIAYDKDKKTNRDYMEASGQNGIPAAFIVGRDGKIDWIGHPMNIDEPIAQVVADKWDRAAAIAEIEKQKKIEKGMEQINLAAQKQDWDTALKIVEELVAANPKLPQLQFAKLQVLQFAGKKDEAAKLRPELVKLAWDIPRALLQLALGVVSEEEGPTRDLELALKAAMRANELTEGQAPVVMMVVAKVYHAQGKLDEAIEWQKKLVTATNEDDDAVKTLKSLEEEKTKGPRDKSTAAPKEGEDKKASDEKDKAAKDESKAPETTPPAKP